MRKNKNRTRNILIAAIFIIAIIAVPVALILPNGSRVHAKVVVTDNNINIQDCYLKKMYAISVLDPENTITSGTNTIKMTITNANTQTDITSVTKINVGVGNCVLDSSTLPDLDMNTELTINFQLLDSNGQLITQNETTIVYK